MRNRRLVQTLSAIGVLLLTGSVIALTESAWCGFPRGSTEILATPFDQPHPTTSSLERHRGHVTPVGLPGPLRILVSSSSNPKTKGRTPASSSSDSAKNQALIEAAKTGRVKEVVRLLKTGANMQASDKKYRMTPLMWACHKNHPEVVKVLLDRGADVNARYGNPQTPLMKAAREGNLEIVRLLLKHGAEVNAKSDIGDTPLHLAAWKGHLDVAKLLLNNGAIVNMKGAQGETPLMVAALNGRVYVAQLLLRRGADADARNAKGETALQLASQRGHDGIMGPIPVRGSEAPALFWFRPRVTASSRWFVCFSKEE
ncbi:MAG: ankyrin repeat domain-containing protein [Deltaproteobacteria bacterium]